MRNNSILNCLFTMKVYINCTPNFFIILIDFQNGGLQGVKRTPSSKKLWEPAFSLLNEGKAIVSNIGIYKFGYILIWYIALELDYLLQYALKIYLCVLIFDAATK